MTQSSHKDCYGTMFPSILTPDAEKLISGKVFAYELIRAEGFLFPIARSRSTWPSGMTASGALSSTTATSSAWEGSPWRRPFRTSG